MRDFTDPATRTNMGNAVHYDPQNGTMKTVSEFLTSPQPIVPISERYAPYPEHMVGGSPYPMQPAQAISIWERAKAPVMQLRTLFARPFGSTAR